MGAYDNVFVLCTGRNGSTTFVEACHHITNYTSKHESLASRHTAEKRFDYPLGHIEADNRLTWFLPLLEKRMQGRNVLYVHLKRDREAVARSYYGRMNTGDPRSIMTAFAHAIVIQKNDLDEEKGMEAARFYVDTVTETIDAFLADKNFVTMNLETISEDFPKFLEMIGAEGDIDAALAEWTVPHNRTLTEAEKAEIARKKAAKAKAAKRKSSPARSLLRRLVRRS